MGRHVFYRCKRCRISSDVTHISRKGYCPDCGEEVRREAAAQIANREGPAYERWVIAWLDAAGPRGRPITPHSPDA